MSMFFVLVAIAVLAAIAFATAPLVLGGEGRSKRLLIAGLVLLVPVLTWLTYHHVGTPEAIDDDFGETGQIRAALIDLARDLERDPDNSDNWIRMGMAYKDMQEYSSAEHALRRALFIDGDNPFIQVELAETLLYASGEPQLPSDGRALLERAVASQPNNQKGLWLLGLDAFQSGRHDEAIEWFERLVAVLPAGDVRQTVQQHLDQARASANGTGRPGQMHPQPQPSPDREQAATAMSMNVSVRLDETLTERVSGDEVVYVIIRGGDNGGPPLAVRRLSAADLPTSIVIDDSDAMLEGRGLSEAGTIRVVARVSHSGQARAAEGDLEGSSEPFEIADGMDIDVEIDRVL